MYPSVIYEFFVLLSMVLYILSDLFFTALSLLTLIGRFDAHSFMKKHPNVAWALAFWMVSEIFAMAFHIHFPT